MEQKTLPRLVIINWEDAISPTHGWTSVDEVKSQLADCISIGVVIAEDSKTITIVSHMSGDESSTDIDGSLVLDKTWIKNIKRLPIPRPLLKKLKGWL
tara:strand:- start:446 stop:739 length:294 start_codon:yes stop_codon:yes gene_type:complete